jgi:hypothetical protein
MNREEVSKLMAMSDEEAKETVVRALGGYDGHDQQKIARTGLIWLAMLVGRVILWRIGSIKTMMKSS